eukprot:5346324-Prymnesium_polylepis.2
MNAALRLRGGVLLPAHGRVCPAIISRTRFARRGEAREAHFLAAMKTREQSRRPALVRGAWRRDLSAAQSAGGATRTGHVAILRGWQPTV